MMNKIKIAPSIITSDLTRVADTIKSLDDNGTDMIHLDVMDGVFVKNITFGPKMVEDIRKLTSTTLDAHLMIVNPQNYVEVFAKAGADIITVHKEACGDNIKKVLNKVKECGVKCGVVISPDTPVEEIKDVVSMCDMVLLMSVYPGFGGQKFIPTTIDKISELKKFVAENNIKVDIEVDGGINEQNAPLVIEAGANVLVAGNSVISSKDMKRTIKTLRGEI